MRAYTEIPEVVESISRPVTLDIIRQIGQLLKLPKETEIFYPGMSEQAAQTGSTLNYDGEPSNFPYHGKIKIEAVENFMEDRALTDTVYLQDARYIFNDPDLRVRLKPVYSSTEIVLTVTYRAQSRVSAERFRDDIKMRTSMMRKENLHELTYHYGIPTEFLFLLQQIHKMREAVLPYGEDLSTWVGKYISPRATNITTLIGTEPQLVIAEHQIQVLGWFDFTAAPEPAQKDSEAGPFDISFEYRVNYDKVIGCVIEYPLVVHNQLIQPPYRGEHYASGDLLSDPNGKVRAPSMSRYLFDYFSSQNQTLNKGNCSKIDGVRYPSFDDFIPNQVFPATSSVFTGMVMVDLNHPKIVINLDQLGDYTLDHNVRDFLVSEAPYLGQLGQSVVHLSLYQDNVPLDDGQLTVDSDLNVYFQPGMDGRQRYHFRMSLVNDLYTLTTDALNRFRSAGAAAIKILLTLQQRLPKGAFVPNLLNGSVIPMRVLMAIANDINSQKVPFFTGLEFRMLTVGNFIVSAERSSDNASGQSQSNSTTGSSDTTGPGDGYTLPRCADGL